jgi:hypothetical protein
VKEHVEYILTIDAEGNKLSGDNYYRFHLPAGIPAKNYWSVIVYDKQTNLIIKNGQPWPSVYSTSKGLVVNAVGSVDICLGPKAPVSGEHNWIKTLPGESWTLILRLYGPMESWFDQSWKPGKIETINKFSIT